MRLTPDTHPNQVVLRLNEVLDDGDQGRLNKLFEGENTDFKNTVRYVIADALDLIGLASAMVYKYPDRMSAIEKAFAQLEPIFKSDPNWRPKTVPEKVVPGPDFRQPVCMRVFGNRLEYVIGAHVISKSRVDAQARIEVRSAIALATEAIKHVRVSKRQRAELWLSVAVAYYLDGDIAQARCRRAGCG